MYMAANWRFRICRDFEAIMTLLEYGVVSAHAEAFSSPHKGEESRLFLMADGRPCIFSGHFS
jgi:hypothetical protein